MYELAYRCLLYSLFAGGIYVFPILAPALAEHLKLTQPQLTSIVLAYVNDVPVSPGTSG